MVALPFRRVPTSVCPTPVPIFKYIISWILPSPKTQESMIKQRDLGMAEGPPPVGPQQFVAPKSLITEAYKLELVQQRTAVN